jgi:hypothetical protein
MPDLEVAEKRDGEARTTEKEAQMTEDTPLKEEQNSDATAEPEATQDVFFAPTLDFLTSKALSYSMNPVLLTSPIAKEEYEPGFEVRTSTFKCSNFDLDVESSPYL